MMVAMTAVQTELHLDDLRGQNSVANLEPMKAVRLDEKAVRMVVHWALWRVSS